MAYLISSVLLIILVVDWNNGSFSMVSSSGLINWFRCTLLSTTSHQIGAFNIGHWNFDNQTQDKTSQEGESGVGDGVQSSVSVCDVEREWQVEIVLVDPEEVDQVSSEG